MIYIDKYAYISKLRKIDPVQKILFAMVTFIVCLWADMIPISLAVLMIMGFITIFAGKIPLQIFLKMMLIPFIFLLLSTITIAVIVAENPGSILIGLPFSGVWLGISSQSLKESARLFFKALGSISCLYFLSLNTPMVDLLTGFRRLKLPGLMIELMGLIYRFIFILLETANNMLISQSSRMGYNNLKNGFKSLGMLFSRLFIRSYKRSEDIYIALEARGYEGALNFLDDKYLQPWTWYFFPLAINISLIISVVLIKY